MNQPDVLSIPVNPFPAFAVENQDQSREDFERVSVETRPRRRLSRFLEDFAAGRIDNCNIGIRGDYGTGKTHLLRYAEVFFQKENEKLLATSAEPSKDFNNGEQAINAIDTANMISTYYCTFVQCRGQSFLEFFCRQLVRALGNGLLVAHPAVPGWSICSIRVACAGDRRRAEGKWGG
jgi:hypothetical protein